MTRGMFKAPREQLRFGDEIAAHAGSLPHRIGRERDDMQPRVDEAVRERARNLAVHLRHDRRARRRDP